MSRWMRFVIAMVLAVALPLQGAAAARFQHCNPADAGLVASEPAGVDAAVEPTASLHAHAHDGAHEAPDGPALDAHDPAHHGRSATARAARARPVVPARPSL